VFNTRSQWDRQAQPLLHVVLLHDQEEPDTPLGPSKMHGFDSMPVHVRACPLHSHLRHPATVLQLLQQPHHQGPRWHVLSSRPRGQEHVCSTWATCLCQHMCDVYVSTCVMCMSAHVSHVCLQGMAHMCTSAHVPRVCQQQAQGPGACLQGMTHMCKSAHV
jgi:hypothetical protein